MAWLTPYELHEHLSQETYWIDADKVGRKIGEMGHGYLLHVEPFIVRNLPRWCAYGINNHFRPEAGQMAPQLHAALELEYLANVGDFKAWMEERETPPLLDAIRAEIERRGVVGKVGGEARNRAWAWRARLRETMRRKARTEPIDPDMLDAFFGGEL